MILQVRPLRFRVSGLGFWGFVLMALAFRGLGFAQDLLSGIKILQPPFECLFWCGLMLTDFGSSGAQKSYILKLPKMLGPSG